MMHTCRSCRRAYRADSARVCPSCGEPNTFTKTLLFGVKQEQVTQSVKNEAARRPALANGSEAQREDRSEARPARHPALDRRDDREETAARKPASALGTVRGDDHGAEDDEPLLVPRRSYRNVWLFAGAFGLVLATWTVARATQAEPQAERVASAQPAQPAEVAAMLPAPSAPDVEPSPAAVTPAAALLPAPSAAVSRSARVPGGRQAATEKGLQAVPARVPAEAQGLQDPYGGAAPSAAAKDTPTVNSARDAVEALLGNRSLGQAADAGRSAAPETTPAVPAAETDDTAASQETPAAGEAGASPADGEASPTVPEASDGDEPAGREASAESPLGAQSRQIRAEDAEGAAEDGNAKDGNAEARNAQDSNAQDSNAQDSNDDQARARFFVKLGQAHLAEGRHGAAQTTFARALALDPQNQEAMAGLASAQKAAQDAP